MAAGQTQATDGHIAQDRHHLGRRAAHCLVVLVKGIAPVADVVEPVFDTYVLTSSCLTLGVLCGHDGLSQPAL